MPQSSQDAEQQEIAKLDSEPAAKPIEPTSGQNLEEELAENVVSKHPEATIPESDVSLADIERKQSHPWRWIVAIVLLLAALIAPYWVGRSLVVNHAAAITANFGMLTSYGIALVSWGVTTMLFVSLVMLLVDNHRVAWFLAFVVFLALEQLIAGVSMFKLNFWNATYVIYGSHAYIANSANLGIIASAIALAVFALVWVGLLVVVRKDSPLNVLTHVWVSFIMLLVFEVVALIILFCGGFMAAA